ncbi:MAG TPA: rRNA maturation RNase YbeY [Gammaproteobacteria bacterium]|nr:rRNA maturation RNase YbeY [Gammaproteobacteria bacterium]
MSVQIDIQIADDISESIEEPPPSHLLSAWAQAAWQGAVDAESVLSLRIVSSTESQNLNHQYRGRNTATNVLSFPMQMEVLSGVEQHEDQLKMAQAILGDLAICAEVVAREAHQQNKSQQAHWAHMVVHGMLHLQGFDHIEDNEAQVMEQLESRIMQQLGFSDPYLTNTSDLIEPSMMEKK